MSKKNVVTTAVEKKATKAVKAVKAEVKTKAVKAEVEQKATAVRTAVETKKVSNTQRCADMIIALATSAKKTRIEVLTEVSNAISALSIVTVKTMLSDLQNKKYASRYSDKTIAIDRTSKIVSVSKSVA